MTYLNKLRIFVENLIRKIVHELRIRIKLLLIIFLTGLLINSYSIYAHYKSVAPNGTDRHLWSAMILLLPALISLLLILVGFLGFTLERRKNFLTMFLVSALYFTSFLICIRVGVSIRMNGFSKLAERSETLVVAIKSYNEKYGKPPEELSNLVPEFMAKVPSTGMAAYPKYKYYHGIKADEYYDGNPWVLLVHTPSGGINWDQFMYLPLLNYSEKGYGGVLKKVGDWAYVIE